MDSIGCQICASFSSSRSTSQSNRRRRGGRTSDAGHRQFVRWAEAIIAMRFTIRHLLWFTLLAAVGCWWWMPSDRDAAHIMSGSYPIPSVTKRYDSEELSTVKTDEKIDFEQRDVVLVP